MSLQTETNRRPVFGSSRIIDPSVVKRINFRKFKKYRKPLTYPQPHYIRPLLPATGATTDELIESAIANVCRAYGVKVRDLGSRCRTGWVAKARSVAMYAVRYGLDQSLIDVGIIFDRHHTTVMENIARLELLIASERVPNPLPLLFPMKKD